VILLRGHLHGELDMATSCKIIANLYDEGLKTSCDFIDHMGEAEQGEITVFQENRDSIKDYMTFEWNYNLLDGTKAHLPDDDSDRLFYISSEATDETGQYPPDIGVYAVFENPVSASGLIIDFYGESVDCLKIVWLNADYTILHEVVAYPNNNRLELKCPVDEFSRIHIDPISTRFPMWALKIVDINFGQHMEWENEEIVSCGILEECNLVSEELPISTLNFEIYSQEDAFNMLNPRGIYRYLKSGQKFSVWAEQNGTQRQMGEWYLDTWKNAVNHISSFSCVDVLGVLEQRTFLNGEIYHNATVGYIVGTIMSDAGWEAYEIEDELREIVLSGHIPICTCREALHQVIFAIGACVNVMRDGTIKICRPAEAIAGIIDETRLFPDCTIEKGEQVARVLVTTHNLVVSDEVNDIYSGILPPGETIIQFSSPASNVKASVGEIVGSGYNYAVIKMPFQGECVLSGNSYTDMTNTLTIISETVSEGKVAEISDAYLVTAQTAAEFARRLLDYYEKFSISTSIRYLNEGEASAEYNSIKTEYGQYYTGAIISQSIDLAGGCIAQASMIALNREMIGYLYTGELFAGEDMGVI